MSTAPGLSSSHATWVNEIRKHFPALERRHNGHAVAYFDGPGGTQTPRAVVEAVSDYLYHHNANTHWAYPTSAETDAILEGARQAMADFLNADATEIVFGANMTTLTFHLARALGRGYGPGDEIVITELDHHANVGPWQALAKERGVTLRTVPLRVDEGVLDWNAFERLLSGRTRLVAMGAASNALGTINAVGQAAERAHRAGALMFVDAVHYAPHALVDARAWNCDFVACSAYKFYGPHEGVLMGRKELLNSIDFPKLQPAPGTAPENAETGTQNHEGIAGVGAAVNFLAQWGQGGTRRERLRSAYEALHAASKSLFATLWNGLKAIPGVRVYGPPLNSPRTPTVSFLVERVVSTEVARRLAERGIFVSHGDFYATTVIERLGLGGEGVVRAGCACYTTQAEIDRLLDGVAAIARGA